MMRKNKMLRKYVPSVLLFLLFEAVAIALWIAKDNLFYLLNFSYIGGFLALGTVLFTAGKRYARHFVQLAVGSYMLLYPGIISRENMQIEGFWYYLFLGVFEAATIHYAVAKIFGPLVFGRGWCGYACWTAMVLAFVLKDNRAFCKYLCPVTVFLKPMSYFSLLRVHYDENKCVHCGKCLQVCPMNVEVNKESRKRKNGTECILCYECTKACPTKALN